ncbi:hypothetical protein [Zhongshania sp.]|uniref:hypothetical protein n=1 Tax=Zhongshania sp. TaxID=1971902 RepID=UPI003565FF70
MAQTKSDNTFYPESRQGASTISAYGNSRAEWWLNVNYAEVIEMRDAVSSRLNKARAVN